MKKTTVRAFMMAIAFTAATFFSIKVYAQPPVGPGNSGSGIFANGTSASSGSPTVPFDGGLSLLLAASGIGYCGRRFKKPI